jgi:hypothetical protein
MIRSTSFKNWYRPSGILESMERRDEKIMRRKGGVCHMNENSYDPIKHKTRLNLSIRIFCLVWICAVFVVDWMLHKMPGLSKPPQFLSDLSKALRAFFSGGYLSL